MVTVTTPDLLHNTPHNYPLLTCGFPLNVPARTQTIQNDQDKTSVSELHPLSDYTISFHSPEQII